MCCQLFIATVNCGNKDTVHQSGRSLLNAFLQAAVDNDCDIHVICSENSPQKYEKHLDACCDSSLIHLYDDFTGYTEDEKGENQITISDLRRHRYNWDKIIQNVSTQSQKNRMVIVDSLSMMALWDGVVTCYKRLKKLSSIWQDKPGLQIVALFHRDAVVNGHSALQKFGHLATTVLNIYEPVKGGDGNPIVQITHKSSGGNVIKQIEEYNVDSSWHVSSVKIKQQQQHGTKENIDTETNMLSNLTFKVELDEKQKEARSQLILPYLRPKLELETNTSSGGKIFYEADAGDDLDEEDPDDDLNI